MSGKIQVYYGEGRGKSTAALGTAIREASIGKSVIFIQFLKGKNWTNLEFMERLEPEIRFFRFEKALEYFEYLSEEEKIEEKKNIINGFHYAKKVLSTGECDVVVLDEVLGLVDAGIITGVDVDDLLATKADQVDVIMTGRVLREEFRLHADEIYAISSEK
jgi:cob(I)alamin adenosyltransferase